MKHAIRGLLLAALLHAPVLLLTGCPASRAWSWERHGQVLEIAFGNAREGWPQMAALHLDTSALRMVHGPESGWGPTFYLAPSLWTDGAAGEAYHLGAPIEHTLRRDGDALLLTFAGTIGGLPFAGEVRFEPPGEDRFEARVTVSTTGSVPLADRPEEAFQPVHTATMRISDTQWDSQAIRVNDAGHPIPLDGWVIGPPGILSDAFTLVGGTSDWKPNSPDITITLDRPMNVQGWATPSIDPNDDNIGVWAASAGILAEWEYEIVSARHDAGNGEKRAKTT